MNDCYRVIQLTNGTVGAVAVGAAMPLGIPTRSVMRTDRCTDTFVVTTGANTALQISEPGLYTFTYTGSLAVADAGSIVLELRYNGVVANAVTITAAAAGTYSVNLNFMVRVVGNCCSGQQNLPAVIQLFNTGVALTGGTSNLLVEGKVIK